MTAKAKLQTIHEIFMMCGFRTITGYTYVGGRRKATLGKMDIHMLSWITK